MSAAPIDGPIAPVLRKIEAAWWRRAAVRNTSLNDAFDEGANDFLPELLPFSAHPTYRDLDAATQSRILSAAWLAYSAKTIAIEKDVLLPGCLALYDDEVPGADGALTKRVISETLTDESYHVLTTQHAMAVAAERRGLQQLRLPTCSVVRSMQELQSRLPERWQRQALLTVTAVVTEVFISGHLRKMSQAPNVQPLHVWTTKLHLADELTHGKIFRTLCARMLSKLPASQLSLFVHLFALSSQWFCDNDYAVWETILGQLAVPGAQALLADCAVKPSTDTNMEEIVSLLEEAGLPGAQNHLKRSARALAL